MTRHNKIQTFQDAFTPTHDDATSPIEPLRCLYCPNEFTGRDRRHAEELRRNHIDRKHLPRPLISEA